ncbi:Uu.00g055430.m01.CDS01 [Anthostomella pinea]|uniref:Uu.00g055430.m01.CDS01 n=1 Tax=Anthostomella pinea TaxID=933095 RepID=A0AAI8YPP2_9PEZI|nr:Uu.00g055430.m01.CDS01 [Anthostomella pinea]
MQSSAQSSEQSGKSEMDAVGNSKAPEFGPRMLQHFDFDPNFRNLNQGSFGASPREIRKKMRHYQDLAEAMPDGFIRYELPKILDESRAAVAKLLNAPTDTVVFVPNATNAINVILQNMTWNEDGKDEILYFDTVYGACGKTIDHIVDKPLGRVSSREIDITYPCEDDDVLSAFQAALDSCASAGKRAKACVFDTVSSLPGVRFPFEEMTEACKAAGVLSIIDGAQGVGMIELDLSGLDPDFFLSNCHKWLHVPRGCAVLYVPFRNQSMITTTVPTSHGYVSTSRVRFNPMPKGDKLAFVSKFEFVGTIDTSPYLCVKDAVKWRQEILGGEKGIIDYIQTLAKEGGKVTAAILGTEVLNNKSGTLSNCAMTNVALPLETAEAVAAHNWMMRVMTPDYKTFIPLRMGDSRLWARISAQVYLGMSDFEWAGHVLLDLCRRVREGEHEKS